MKRRKVLEIIATTPIAASGVTKAETLPNEELVKETSANFFQAFKEIEEEEQRRQNFADCALFICDGTEFISQETLDTIIETGEVTDDTLRVLVSTVEVLNELNITSAIDSTMIKKRWGAVGDYTKYIPLLGSFNVLRQAACDVNVQNPTEEQVNGFLRASLAFGISVVLWSISAPYRMAFSGTRFVANRTILRLSGRGCDRCIAFAMREFHDAIRALPYAFTTESSVEFIQRQIKDAQRYAEDNDIDIEIELTNEDIRAVVEEDSSDEDNGFFDFEIPEFDIPDIDVDLSDYLP